MAVARPSTTASGPEMLILEPQISSWSSILELRSAILRSKMSLSSKDNNKKMTFSAQELHDTLIKPVWN